MSKKLKDSFVKKGGVNPPPPDGAKSPPPPPQKLVGWHCEELQGFGLPNPQLVERVMTEKLIIMGATYEVNVEWEYNMNFPLHSRDFVICHAFTTFKNQGNIIAKGLTVHGQGKDLPKALTKLSRAIGTLRDAGVLEEPAPVIGEPILRYTGKEVPEELKVLVTG